MEQADNLIRVLPADRRPALLLGEGRESSAPLVWSSFHLRQPTDEGLLLYNTLTLELLHVPAALVPALETPEGALRETLRKKWFLVPADLDQHRTARELREALYLMEQRPEGIEKFTVLTTTACNARCFYCYEKGWQPITMRPELAEQTADYILRHAAPSFHIDWFGGEPLVNMAAIDRISDRLLAAKADFSASMFSNCYLIDEAVARRAAERWRLRTLTVTIDGRRELYNRVKAYVNPTEDPFTRVIRNIHLLDQAGVEPIIRVNLDTFNRAEAYGLVEELIREFGGSKKRDIRITPVYEKVDDPATWFSEADRSGNFRAMAELRRRLVEAGLCHETYLERSLPTHRCMADSGNMVMILPDGKLGLCEHYLRDHYIGDIWSETLDRQVMEKFRELHPEIPACADCPNYPLCIRLKKCDSAICYPQMREYLEQNRRDAMLSTWKHYLQREAVRASEARRP